ncbi:MAG TPA: DinB family protein [Thermoanaerobaculia bacterium]
MKRNVTAFVVLGLMLVSLAAAAQEKSKVNGVRADIISHLADIESKLVQLAEATPADKLSWRPAEGIRSTCEVFMHVAAGNYMISGMIGHPAPKDLDLRGLEKSVTEKKKVIETLRASFAHAKAAVEKVNDADLAKPAKFFGQQTTIGGIALNLAVHGSEHLGQSIAYARSTGVVPPWSRAE